VFWLTPQHIPEELLATIPPIIQLSMLEGSGPIWRTREIYIRSRSRMCRMNVPSRMLDEDPCIKHDIMCLSPCQTSAGGYSRGDPDLVLNGQLVLPLVFREDLVYLSPDQSRLYCDLAAIPLRGMRWYECGHRCDTYATSFPLCV
jgi:hypothetical protein